MFGLLFLSLLGFVWQLHFCLFDNAFDATEHLAPYSNATLCFPLSNRSFSISVSSYVCLALDNKYSYLTDSFNKATPFRADPLVLKYRVTRGRCWLENSVSSFPSVRTYYRRSEQSVHGKRGLRVIRARYIHVTTKQPSLDQRKNGH